MDPEDKVPELIEEENNIWNGTVTVVVQSPGWDIHPGGGGESGGKSITGRLMKGVVVPGGKEAGGGGKSEFSPFRFLMQLLMLAVTIVLVYAGYLMERRRQNNKLSLQKRI